MSRIFSAERLIKFALPTGLILIAVIFLSGLGDNGANTAEQQLEQRLCDMICSMEELENAEKPHVMVRLAKDGYTVTGAAVVCKGSENPVVKEKLLEMIGKALDIPMSKISISA